MKFNSILSTFILAVSSLALLTACGGTTTSDQTSPEFTRQQSIVPTTITTPIEPSVNVDRDDQYGANRESLSSTKRAYERNSSDSFVAARYAKALREDGNLSEAEKIIRTALSLSPVSQLAYTEMGALQLERGNLSEAESYARRAVKIDDKNFRAWHIIAISLDAQEKHPEAETAFRKALSLWQGDTIPVMNNLALNLAAQGYTDQALQLLNKIKEKVPNRVDIERNIRIIRTLNEPSDYKPAKPTTKPAPPKKLPPRPPVELPSGDKVG
jgi:Flp pilus assembly protein TadD